MAQNEDLVARLKNRVGQYSADRRHISDLHACNGDTVDASVTITAVEGAIDGKTFNGVVTYSGHYGRQGWMPSGLTPIGGIPFGCIQSRSFEGRQLSGRLAFSITQVLWSKPILSIGKQFDVGEVDDIQHDSNDVARQCAIKAIASAFDL